jgi:hypothetical protein
MDWSSWVQGVSKDLIGAAADAKWRQPYEIERLRLQALGENGYYEEGQPGTRTPSSGGGGINPTWLLIGGAVLLVVMLKD